jgi:hypothetical protein
MFVGGESEQLLELAGDFVYMKSLSKRSFCRITRILNSVSVSVSTFNKSPRHVLQYLYGEKNSKERERERERERESLKSIMLPTKLAIMSMPTHRGRCEVFSQLFCSEYRAISSTSRQLTPRTKSLVRCRKQETGLSKLNGMVPIELSKNMFGVDQWWVLLKRK